MRIIHIPLMASSLALSSFASEIDQNKELSDLNFYTMPGPSSTSTTVLNTTPFDIQFQQNKNISSLEDDDFDFIYSPYLKKRNEYTAKCEFYYFNYPVDTERRLSFTNSESFTIDNHPIKDILKLTEENPSGTKTAYLNVRNIFRSDRYSYSWYEPRKISKEEARKKVTDFFKTSDFDAYYNIYGITVILQDSSDDIYFSSPHDDGFTKIIENKGEKIPEPHFSQSYVNNAGVCYHESWGVKECFPPRYYKDRMLNGIPLKQLPS